MKTCEELEGATEAVPTAVFLLRMEAVRDFNVI
jgi:hypothetical protein